MSLGASLQEMLDLGGEKPSLDIVPSIQSDLESIDHRTLDRLKDLADGDCASLAQWILARTQPLLPALNRIDLQETAGNGCVLGGADDGRPLLPA